MYEKLNNENFTIYAAKNYTNPQCLSTDEFNEDLIRIKYIKKLITRYIEKKDLKERLILNHIIVLNNVFNTTQLCKMLYLKMKYDFEYIMPFLLYLNILPDKLYNVGNEHIVYLEYLKPNKEITEALKKI